jgi:hypothetical protein
MSALKEPGLMLAAGGAGMSFIPPELELKEQAA